MKIRFRRFAVSFYHQNAVFVILLLFTFVYGYISVIKHYHFQTFAWDLSFFDQLIWKISRGIEPRSSLNNLHILGDHFQPILYLFVPLYWIKGDVRLLLMAHSIIGVLGSYPIYLLGKKVLKNTEITLAIVLSFLLFTGFQSAILDGVHQSVFAVFFIGWIFYFLETNKTSSYWLATLGLLFTKEEYALLVGAIGIVIMFYYKRFRLGLMTLIFGVLSFFFLIYAIIPFYQKGAYTHFGYGSIGETPLDVMEKFVAEPNLVFWTLLLPLDKIKTVASTFLAFGFLPVLSPLHVIPVVQQFVVRFLDDRSIHRWLNNNHYAFPLVPLMSIAAIYGLKRLRLRGKRRLFLALYIISFSLIQDFIIHGPINTLVKPSFYKTQQWEYDAHELIRQIPKDVVVASTNTLLPHLSQRNKFYLLPEIGDAEYVAIDLKDGPNKFSPLNLEQTSTLISNLLDRGKFEITWHKNDSILLRRRVIKSK